MAGNGKSQNPGVRVLNAIRSRVWTALGCAFLLSAGLNILMLTSPIYMMQLFDRVMSGRHEETLFLLTGIALFAYMAWGLLDWARNLLMRQAANWLERELSASALRAGLQASVSGLPAGAQGIRDLDQIKAVFGGRALYPFLDLPWAGLFFLILFVVDVWVGIFATGVAILLVLLAVCGEWFARKPLRESLNRQAEVRQWADQSINQAEVVHALGMRESLIGRYYDRMQAAHRDNQVATRWAETFGALARTIRQMSQVGVMALAGWLLLQGEMSPGLVIGGSIIMARALAPLDSLVQSWQQLIGGWVAYRRFQELLEKHLEEGAGTELPAPQARIQIANLHKRRPGSATEFLLKGVTFDLEAGDCLSVIGASGSGKTTLCRCLAGVIRPEMGEVRLDGARLDQWDPEKLGPHIGYLPQDVGLPPATVAETIARLAAEPDMEAVYAAAKQANAHDLILSLPLGYDTPVGAGGLALSGGQRQRVGLARALYGDPVLIILDEPDAHLDMDGSRELSETIQQLSEAGAIIVQVSHRPNFIRETNKVLVMAAGTVADFGPARDVMTRLKRKPVNDGPKPVQALESRQATGRGGA